MYQQFLANSDLLQWPLLALGIFFAVFVAVLVYVLVGLRGRRPEIDRMAASPLEDDEEPSFGGRTVARGSGRACGEGGAA